MKPRLSFCPGVWAAVLLVASSCALAGAGMVKTAQGTVTIERSGQKIAAQTGAVVEAADRVITGADGRVGITLADSTRLSAGPNSVLDLNQFVFDPVSHAGKIDASVKRGTLSVISGKIAHANPSAVTFRTPTTTLGVRGTEFIIDVKDHE